MAAIAKKVIREDGTPGWWRNEKGKRAWEPRRDEKGNPVPWLDKHGRPRYYVQVFVGGPQSTRCRADFTRRKDAAAWARKLETRKDKGERPTTDRRTVADYMEWWLRMKAKGAVAGLKQKKGRVPRARTMSDYRKAVERWIVHPPPGLLPNLGAHRLDKLTCEVLDRFYDAMLEQGHATAGRVRRLHGILRQALEEPTRKGSLARNPTDWASVPQADAVESGAAMDKAQATRFLTAARQDRYSALWHVLLLGGLRPGEAFGLQWKDVDMEAGTVQVVRNLVRVPGTKGWQLELPKTKHSKRLVPLPAVAMQELRAWKVQQTRDRLQVGPEWQEHDFVFTTELGTPLYGARRSFVRVCEAAELGEWGPEPQKPRSGPTAKRSFKPAFRIYDLRHTCATLLLLAGESLKVVSERLGHASINLTADTYSHVLPTMQRAAADKLDAMFGTG